MKDDFFIGWSNTPGPRTCVFLALVATVFIAGLAVMSAILSAASGTPADRCSRRGNFRKSCRM